MTVMMEQQPEQQSPGSPPIKLNRPIYTVPEISYILNYKDDRPVRTMLKNGTIKGFKVNGMWRVHKADLQEFLDERYGAQQ